MNTHRPGKILIAAAALAIFLLSYSVWQPRQKTLRAARQALADKLAAIDEMEERLKTAQAESARVRVTIQQQKPAQARVAGDVAVLERELAAGDPEAQWVAPPPDLPKWDPSSPYVWLPKELLPQFPVSVFSKNGTLAPEVAAVLTATPEQQKAVNSELSRLLDYYRSLEVTHARYTDDHLAGISGLAGDKLTVIVDPMPDEGARCKLEFENTLRSQLGQQRAGLVLESADGWLSTQFSEFGTESKTISAVRHPDGTYNISVKSGNSWSSVGGPRSLEGYVPAHLLPLFQSIAPQPADNVSTAK